MATETSICNQALSWCAARQILSIDDKSDEAVACKANYANMRDTVLEARAWTFATRRAKLPSVPLATDGSDWGYASKFSLPSTCVRVLVATDDISEPNSWDKSFNWRREGQYIVTDSDTVYIKYIEKITDPALFSPGFSLALAAKIASVIAIPLTESTTLQDKMELLYAKYLKDASGQDGTQGASDRIKSSGFTRVR